MCSRGVAPGYGDYGRWPNGLGVAPQPGWPRTWGAMSPEARARGHTAFKPLPMGPVLRISDPGRSVQAAEIAVSCCRKASAAGTTPERSCARTVVCPQTGPASVFCWVTKRPGHSGWKFSGSKFSGQGGDLLRKDQKRMLTATQASRQSMGTHHLRTVDGGGWILQIAGLLRCVQTSEIAVPCCRKTTAAGTTTDRS